MVRPSVFAGSFYPNDPEELRQDIQSNLNKVKLPEIKGEVRAIIVPHAGYPYSGPVAAYGYKAVENYTFEESILLGPSHRTLFNGLALCNFSAWKTPLGEIKTSILYEKFEKKEYFEVLNEVHAFEHALEVQLPLLQTVQKDTKITPIVTGGIHDYKGIASTLQAVISNTPLLIVSSDLSHYLPYKEANKVDKKTIDRILQLKPPISHEEACGADGINILIELAKINDWKPLLLDYRNSGDTAGDKNQVVGYTSIAFSKK